MTGTPLREALSRNLVFVAGKGGVGKTVVSRAIARELASKGMKTLWIEFEDPLREPNELVEESDGLYSLNCEPSASFEEYAALKIGVPALTRIFLQNKLMKYFSKAAPGIHELVLLGKVWHERLNYDRIVVDMPSTGYGLAMFQSTVNFARLFRGGPIHNDAEAMLATFRDRRETGHVIVALPEEMPLQEGLELAEHLEKLFPENPPAFLANRVFPDPGGIAPDLGDPEKWQSPIPASALDYARKRRVLEEHNLRLWRNEGIQFGELAYVTPGAPDGGQGHVVAALARRIGEIA